MQLHDGAQSIAGEVFRNGGQRNKSVRLIMRKFDCGRRTDGTVREMTSALAELGVTMRPGLQGLGMYDRVELTMAEEAFNKRRTDASEEPEEESFGQLSMTFSQADGRAELTIEGPAEAVDGLRTLLRATTPAEE